MRPLVNLALLVHLASAAGSPLERAPQVLDEHLQPPQQDFHFLSTDTAFTNESCTLSIAAQSERTDFSKWGKGDRWPALHLIGAQKAATTSVATALSRCGLIAYGQPHKGMTFACDGGAHAPCKEVFHSPLSDAIETTWAKDAYAGQFNTARCDSEESKMAACGPGEQNEACKNLRWQKDACERGAFLEGSPHISGASFHHYLNNIPPNLLGESRFVAIFREPASRMLSWYNHQLAANLLPDGIRSFHDYVESEIGRKDSAAIDMGRYVDYLTALNGTFASRPQMLVLAYTTLIGSPSLALNLITRHYGLPQVISEVPNLPETNENESPQKVVKMKCATRTLLEDLYSPFNQQLLARLKVDHDTQIAPSIEPSFPPFDSAPCDGRVEETASPSPSPFL